MTVKITEMDSSFSRNVKFYTSMGTVQGLEAFINNGLRVSPKLIQISPNEGSPGGSYVYATVLGAGVKSQGITLVD